MRGRRQRPASRILLLDPAERILLFRYHSPDRPPFWCTPGDEEEFIPPPEKPKTVSYP